MRFVEVCHFSEVTAEKDKGQLGQLSCSYSRHEHRRDGQEISHKFDALKTVNRTIKSNHLTIKINRIIDW